MIASTLEEANQKYEELVLALQYTIAQRERLKKLLQVAGRAAELYPSANASEIIDMILKTPAEHAQDVFAYIFSGVDFHPEVTRVFHRELTRLKVMFCGLCWGQDMRGLPFRFGYC